MFMWDQRAVTMETAWNTRTRVWVSHAFMCDLSLHAQVSLTPSICSVRRPFPSIKRQFLPAACCRATSTIRSWSRMNVEHSRFASEKLCVWKQWMSEHQQLFSLVLLQYSHCFPVPHLPNQDFTHKLPFHRWLASWCFGSFACFLPPWSLLKIESRANSSASSALCCSWQS